jgi:hypothetical protein
MSDRHSRSQIDTTTAEVNDNVNGQIRLASFGGAGTQGSHDHLRYRNGTLWRTSQSSRSDGFHDNINMGRREMRSTCPPAGGRPDARHIYYGGLVRHRDIPIVRRSKQAYCPPDQHGVGRSPLAQIASISLSGQSISHRHCPPQNQSRGAGVARGFILDAGRRLDDSRWSGVRHQRCSSVHTAESRG